MRNATLALLTVVSLAAGAQGSNTAREEWQESAAEMGFGPCPMKVRREVGIDSTEDWRIYADHGFRYCVPAWWTTRRPKPLHPDRIVWIDGDGSEQSQLSSLVTGRVSVPVGVMYPPDYPEGSRPGMWMGTIGGVKVEMWGSNRSTIAIFRSEELMFTAGSKDRYIADLQKKVIRSVRFTATSVGGNP
jgi:hypothetical protein